MVTELRDLEREFRGLGMVLEKNIKLGSYEGIEIIQVLTVMAEIPSTVNPLFCSILTADQKTQDQLKFLNMTTGKMSPSFIPKRVGLLFTGKANKQVSFLWTNDMTEKKELTVKRLSIYKKADTFYENLTIPRDPGDFHKFQIPVNQPSTQNKKRHFIF